MKSRVFILLIITALILSACALPFNQRPGDPPSHVEAIPGNSRATLTWEDPEGKYFDHVEISVEPEVVGLSQPVIYSKGIEQAIITGLTNGVSYTFSLSAITSGGTPNEDDAPVVYARPMPPIPTIQSAVASSSSMRITWAVDPDLSSSEISGILVSCVSVERGIKQETAVSVSNGTYSFSGLQPDSEYAFYLSYINNPENAALKQNKIGAGFIARVGTTTVTPGKSAIHPGKNVIGVSWEDPACIDLQLMELEILPRRPDSAPVLYVDKGKGYQTLDDRYLSVSQGEYKISLAAIDEDNRVYYLLQEAGPVKFNIFAPETITGLTAFPRNNGAYLSWSAPADSSLKSYEIRIYTAGNDLLRTETLEAEGGEDYAVISGLANGQAYDFSIVSIDWSGNRSVESSRVAATPVEKTINPVTIDSATPGTRSISLTWLEPEQPEQDDVREIEITFISGAAYVSPRAATTIAVRPIAVRPGIGKALVLGLQNGQSYTLGVTVVGTNGERSETITAGPIETLDVTGPEAADTDTFTLQTGSFSTAFVPRKTYATLIPAAVTLSDIEYDFWMGTTEVTYAVWKEVSDWSLNNGYSFINNYICGSHHCLVTTPPPGVDIIDEETVYRPEEVNPLSWNEDQPVTNISWRESLVWYNAATEYYNSVHGASLRCAYYEDSALTRPLRQVPAAEVLATNKGQIDNPYVDLNADGFRFPTFAEWELADRYKADLDRNGILSGTDEIKMEETAEVTCWAWDVYNTLYHSGPVASLPPNDLGIYDMHGNMWEYCWDPRVALTSASVPVIRYVGGSWANGKSHPAYTHHYPVWAYYGDYPGGAGAVTPWVHAFSDYYGNSYRKGLRVARTAY